MSSPSHRAPPRPLSPPRPALLGVLVLSWLGGCSAPTEPLDPTPPAPTGLIVRADQSDPTGTSDPVLTLEVETVKSRGLEMSFSWTNTLDLFGTVTSTETTSRFTLGLPCAPAGQPLEFTVRVAEYKGRSDSRTFTVPARPACAPWTMTGGLGTARDQHTATLLPNGQVLVVGGTDGTQALASAELYDPATRAWRPTGAMSLARYEHTATLLDNGQVLVVGSHDSQSRQAELYDPATGTWSPTGPLAEGRGRHTATLLPDGKVLVVGGVRRSRFNEYPETTELYDPATGTWSPASDDPVSFYDSRAALLPNGKVLVTGLTTLASKSVEYTPATRFWDPARSMLGQRPQFTLTSLPDGRVLAVGGDYLGETRKGGAADLYEPDSGTWSRTSPMVSSLYNSHASAVLPDGRVLVTGGFVWTLQGLIALPTAQIYAPATGRWTRTGDMALVRANHTATRLLSGQVLVVGGNYHRAGVQVALASAELYDPTTGP